MAKHRVEVQFLLRGLVRASRVSLLPDRISFGTVLVGKRSEQVIHISNDEDISMRFVFDNALMQGTPASSVAAVLPANALLKSAQHS